VSRPTRRLHRADLGTTAGNSREIAALIVLHPSYCAASKDKNYKDDAAPTNILSKGNVLIHKLPYSHLLLASILPYCCDILRSHNFVQSLHMALSRSNNEVTSCSGRELDWRSRTYGHRVSSTAPSNDLLSSSVIPVLVAPPSFTRNMSKSWVGMYAYAGFIRCVDILVYAPRQATYRSYSGKPDFSRWTRSQCLTS
jgi:hypothetical protein